jgi:hypothetical protein
MALRASLRPSAAQEIEESRPEHYFHMLWSHSEVDANGFTSGR